VKGPKAKAVTDSICISNHLKVCSTVKGPEPRGDYALALIWKETGRLNVPNELPTHGGLLAYGSQIVRNVERPETDQRWRVQGKS
jgi:hypothetical protein